MINVSNKFIFILACAILACGTTWIGFERFETNLALPKYSKDQVLTITHSERNVPLVKELYRLGDRVGDLKEVKSKTIINKDQREAHVLLSKICKDSCLPIRCRLDPGLGQACRVNCPSRKIRFCITTLKPIGY